MQAPLAMTSISSVAARWPMSSAGTPRSPRPAGAGGGYQAQSESPRSEPARQMPGRSQAVCAVTAAHVLDSADHAQPASNIKESSMARQL